jgi:hypothetical protein
MIPPASSFFRLTNHELLSSISIFDSPENDVYQASIQDMTATRKKLSETGLLGIPFVNYSCTNILDSDILPTSKQRRHEMILILQTLVV